MSSTPIVNNSLVAPPNNGSSSSAATPAAISAGMPPLYGSTADSSNLNTNEPLYSSSAPCAPAADVADAPTATTAAVVVDIPLKNGLGPNGAAATPASAVTGPQVAPPTTFHDATIEAARSTAIKLGVAEIILGGSLFGLMTWTYQSARVAGQMSLICGIILLCHSASKTAPLMRNKAYGGCCPQTCPWKILRVLCIATAVINFCSALAMTVLAVLSFTVWSNLSEDKSENLATQICCTLGAFFSLMAGILAWKACRPCTIINERLATLVANGVLAVSFEYMWCAHPYLAPVVTNNNNGNTTISPSAENNNTQIVVVTGAVVEVPQQQVEEVSSSCLPSSSYWNNNNNFHQVEVQPVAPMQEQQQGEEMEKSNPQTFTVIA